MSPAQPARPVGSTAQRLAAPALLLVGGWLATALMPAPTVRPPALPARSADVLRVLTLGHDTTAATLTWAAAVAHAVAAPEGAPVAPGLASAVRRVGALDARWSIPWAYGALWLASIDAIDESEALLDEASDRFATDPWFPWALGMSRWLNHADEAGAAYWLDVAASRPGAPSVHATAADALRARVPPQGQP